MKELLTLLFLVALFVIMYTIAIVPFISSLVKILLLLCIGFILDKITKKG